MSFSAERIRAEHGVYFLGLLCFWLGVVHLFTEGEGLGTVLESFIICSMSGLVLVTGYQLPNRPISERGQWRTVWVGLGVMVSFALLALSIWLIWKLNGTETEFFFLISFASSLGAAVGSRGGLYAIESEERLEEARDLANLLTINQRVLRHNLRNELSISLGYLRNIEAGDRDEDVGDDVRMIEKHLRRLLTTTERTREIVSIWENDQTATFDLATVLEAQIARIEEEYPDVEIATEFDADCRVECHPALPRAIREALENAIEHTSEGTPITARVRRDQDGMAVVEVSDTGKGIPKFDVEAIEGQRETPLNHTQGLGLWIIYWTVKMSGGTLELVEGTPQGTTVRITLPEAR
ncbi:sensor histidine kinase [Halolamina sp. C58]|uniref:sensor histidine kinase n=1 Tax=Halolamina sp. C58 TaxID=3421640 RepID=UPI003EB93588